MISTFADIVFISTNFILYRSTHGHVKRPLTAFMLFLQSIRDEIKIKYPGINVREIAKKAGEMWRELKDKSDWQAKGAQKMQEYADAIKAMEAQKALKNKTS